MSSSEDAYLTTRELADLLRIKERKVYELANNGDVPCVRVVGKLLFPRDQINQWIDSASSGPGMRQNAALPPTVLGSHDPLLDWALKESGCALAAFFDGSRDGIQRLMQREGLAAGTHIYEADEWNVGVVKRECRTEAVVLMEFAQRNRGLIVAKTNPKRINTIKEACNFKVAQRQEGAASQQLFKRLAQDASIQYEEINRGADLARTEDELGMQVFDGKVDVAFGLQSVANRLKLDFIPVMQERFDLLVWQQAWFDKPFQLFINFARGDEFANQAKQLGGYDISGLGTVRYNSP